MKRCTYCGAEYSDNAAVCAIDGNCLDDPAKPVKEKAPVVGSPTVIHEHKIYPEYQWSARDGWKFLGMILVFNFLWLLMTIAFNGYIPGYRAWHSGPYGTVIMTSVFIAMNALIAAYFARTETLLAFCDATGLNHKPTEYAWFGVAFAICLRIIGHVIYALGWARTYSDRELSAFHRSHELSRYLYLLPLLAAAFWEEPIKRGFAYRAFRGSYPIAGSMAIIVVYTAWAHWNQYSHWGWAVFSLSALTIVQCYLREKSDSIWDCIFCHLVFNGSTVFVSGFFR